MTSEVALHVKMLCQIGFATNSTADKVTLLSMIFCGAFVWLFIRMVRRMPSQPDPWSQEVASSLENEDAVPLCTHCLAQHEHDKEFCAQCGGPVGAYTNLMPFEYLFSVGHLFRIGTQGNYKRSRILIFGFILLSAAEYAVFAPAYWIMLCKNISRQRRTAALDADEANKPER
jgi:hypothetical protein